MLAAAVLAVLPAAAGAEVRTFTDRHGPVEVGAYGTEYPVVPIRPPRADGYVVGMHARLEDARGRPVTIRDVMLHHVVFRRVSPRTRPLQCVHRSTEAFYSNGEEDQRLRLPEGYGYRLRREDRWRMSAMLMSHRLQARKVYVRWHVRVETGRRLTPVQPIWLRAIGCDRPSTSYPVAGGGGPGAVDRRTLDWRVPYDGRIVAAGGHLHGGAKDMWLTQPGCRDRRLLDTRPRFGMPGDLVYRLRPLLHEPGPIDTRYFLSRTGIPVRRGEVIRLNADYDAEHPHWAVMSTMHVYLARESRRPRSPSCAPLPADRVHLTKPGPVRTEPPVVRIPLTGLDDRGRTFEITDLPWPVRPVAPGAVLDVRDGRFTAPRVSVPPQSLLTWSFQDREAHDLTFATGPRALGTPKLARGQHGSVRFDEPGEYRFFCSLHPVTMHQVVDVRPPS